MNVCDSYKSLGRGFGPRLLLACCLVFTLQCSRLVRGDEAKESTGAARSNENLGAELLKDANSPATKLNMGRPSMGTKSSEAPALTGEDIGAGQGGALGGDGLKRVTKHMRTAEAILAAKDATGKASELQTTAIGELDAMIARLQKQCEKCGGQCKKPGASSRQPKPGGKAGAAPGQSAATVANASAMPASRAAIDSLVKDLWGRLPERQRDELLQPLSEEFLPAYAADIEEYFRVLAESPEDKGGVKRR